MSAIQAIEKAMKDPTVKVTKKVYALQTQIDSIKKTIEILEKQLANTTSTEENTTQEDDIHEKIARLSNRIANCEASIDEAKHNSRDESQKLQLQVVSEHFIFDECSNTISLMIDDTTRFEAPYHYTLNQITQIERLLLKQCNIGDNDNVETVINDIISAFVGMQMGSVIKFSDKSLKDIKNDNLEKTSINIVKMVANIPVFLSIWLAYYTTECKKKG